MYKVKALTNIDTWDGKSIIRRGNIYESIRYCDDFVKIMCDDGYMRRLYSGMFIRIDSLRDKKLKELGL